MVRYHAIQYSQTVVNLKKSPMRKQKPQNPANLQAEKLAEELGSVEGRNRLGKEAYEEAMKARVLSKKPK